jgi:dipeptidyl aminopeptidase/acylaminoacyl peptidase
MTRRINARDLYTLRSVADPNVSSDGRYLAYVVARSLEDEDRLASVIKIRSLVDDEPDREIAHHGAQLSSPRWSPDGVHLAYLSTETDLTEAFVYSLDDEQSMKITSSARAVAELCWEPDGQAIIYVSETDGQEKNDYESDTIVIRSLAYRFNGEGIVEGRRKHLYRSAIGIGDVEQLTSGDLDAVQPAPSPDGQRLAFTAKRMADRDSHLESDVWLLDRSNGNLSQVTPGDGSYGNPTWSPDGGRLAYTGHPIRLDGPFPVQEMLFVFDLRSGTHRQLMSEVDRGPGTGSASDTVHHAPLNVLSWSVGGGEVFTLVPDGGNVSLYACGVDSGDVRVLQTAGEIQSYCLAPDGTCYLSQSSMTEPVEMFVLDGESTITRITDENQRFADEVRVGRVVDFWIEEEPGARVHSWVVLPPEYDSSRTYPAIVAVHGGPHAMYSAGFYYWVQVISAADYVVLMPNPRASTGYGQDWLAALQDDWGGGDFRDVMLALDGLLERFSIDPRRIGITGESYGGYMTNWAITQTDRFAAAVTQNSSCNRYSLYGTADMVMMYSDWEFGGSPYEVPQNYLERSPIAHVARAKTPVLILHSENDMRVPISQGEEWFVALKSHGVDVEFVRFPGEHHMITRLGTPRHRIERIERTRRWFDCYLKGD